MAYMALHYYIYVNIRGTCMILANNNFLRLIKVYSRLNIVYLPCVRWLLFEIWINITQHSPCRFWFFILSCPRSKLGSWLSWVGYPCMKCLLHTISSGFGVHVFLLAGDVLLMLEIIFFLLSGSFISIGNGCSLIGHIHSQNILFRLWSSLYSLCQSFILFIFIFIF